MPSVGPVLFLQQPLGTYTNPMQAQITSVLHAAAGLYTLWGVQQTQLSKPTKGEQIKSCFWQTSFADTTQHTNQNLRMQDIQRVNANAGGSSMALIDHSEVFGMQSQTASNSQHAAH